MMLNNLNDLSEHTNADWWFVKKHLTQEKGWVPAQYLLDEANYTLYVQRKLNEKIDKLPVFESTSIKRLILLSYKIYSEQFKMLSILNLENDDNFNRREIQ